MLVNNLKLNKVDYTEFDLLREIEKGISYNHFKDFSEDIPFTTQEWADILHVSERTLMRYSKENKKFDTLPSQQIIEIAALFGKGKELFGSIEAFSEYLDTNSLALGDRKPKDLLTSTVGIRIIRNELIRIEHGVLA
jgi:putative toxin-antitoxin system antitoxin component (TIGR02293 family)